MDVLRISFDGLDEMEKEIFIDIACFFDGERENYVKRVLDYCGFHPTIEIRVLIEKSLLTIFDGIIDMHALLVELGKKIAREKSAQDPRKWSRLWLYKDFQNVMLEDTAIESPEAIVMQYPGMGKGMTTMELRVEALSKMNCLRLLILKGIDFRGSFNCLSNKLQYLEWESYPFKYYPSNFQPDKLVELKLLYSNIKELWDAIKVLPNLRTMDLRHSKNLIKMPDFRGAPNLKVLNLKGCTKLVQINPSIGHLRKLLYLNLKNCSSLTSLPSSMLSLSSLQVLNLFGCSKVLNYHPLGKPRHLKRLKLDTSERNFQVQSTSSSIWERLMLPFRFIYSRRHEDSTGSLLPSFSCLISLDLSFCNLFQIPDAIVWLHCLENLDLGGNHFGTLPSSIKELPRLRSLDLQHCKQLKYLSEHPSGTILPVRTEACGGRYRPGLYIYNCPKLTEMERCNSMAFSWMIQVLQYQVLKASSLPFDWIAIVIPGTQVPKWFTNQSVGRSITIEPSPIVHDRNWIGVACCAVFVAHDDPTNVFNIKPKFYLEIQNRSGPREYHLMTPLLVDKDLGVAVELHHLLLCFLSRQKFINIVSWLRELASYDDIQLSIRWSKVAPAGLQFEVKNIGWRWVFKHDLEE